MGSGKGNKHSGRKTRIKNWKESKWWRESLKARAKRKKRAAS